MNGRIGHADRELIAFCSSRVPLIIALVDEATVAINNDKKDRYKRNDNKEQI